MPNNQTHLFQLAQYAFERITSVTNKHHFPADGSHITYHRLNEGISGVSYFFLIFIAECKVQTESVSGYCTVGSQIILPLSVYVDFVYTDSPST